MAEALTVSEFRQEVKTINVNASLDAMDDHKAPSMLGPSDIDSSMSPDDSSNKEKKQKKKKKKTKKKRKKKKTKEQKSPEIWQKKKEEGAKEITVKTLNGSLWKLITNRNDTIYTLKSKIESDHGIPIDQQCLFLNEELLNNNDSLSSYQITSETKMKLILVSYQRHKIDQERITNTTKKSGCNLANALIQSTQGLDTMLLKSQNLANSTTQLSSLNSITPHLYSQLTHQISKILAIIEAFRQKTEEAKAMIDNNLQNKLSDCLRGKVKCLKEIEEIDTKIDKMNQEIAQLQNQQNKVDQLKQAIQAFQDEHYVVYKDLCVSMKNEIIAALTAVNTDVENTYNRCIQDIEKKKYAEKIKEMLCNKWMLLEKEYKTWDAANVMEWIKTIEERYFDDYQFDQFVHILEQMEIEGNELPEIDSTFFLEITAGLEEKKDQCILKKHINRIVKGEDDMVIKNNVCGLCTRNLIDTVIVPCGHCCWCYGCSQKEQVEKCPICSVTVTIVLQMFMAGIANT